jgi:hypothetical protein
MNASLPRSEAKREAKEKAARLAAADEAAIAAANADPGTTADPKWVHEQLVRTEEHWTAQRQNQQARVATTLTVAGVMLTLLAPLAFTDHPHRFGWAHQALVVACILLALSLLPGVAALLPRIPPEEHRYVDPAYFKGLSPGVQVEPNVFYAVKVSFPKTGITDLVWRRRAICAQLALIAGAAGLLAASFTQAWG